MKTWFQISMKRSSSTAGPPSGPWADPRSTKISEHGPAGPAACVHQKLSALPRRTILPAGIPRSCQIPMLSSSFSNTLTQIRSRSMPNPSVTSSRPQAQDSALK